MAAEAGVLNIRTQKPCLGNYDDDLDPDLYVSCYGHPNHGFTGTMETEPLRCAPDLGVDRPIWSFPAWFWDFNNDGAIDIFVGSYEIIDGTGAVARSYLGLPFKGETLRLYQGDGKGGFQEVSRQQKLTQLSLPMGRILETWITMGIRIFIWARGIQLHPAQSHVSQSGEGIC